MADVVDYLSSWLFDYYPDGDGYVVGDFVDDAESLIDYLDSRGFVLARTS